MRILHYIELENFKRFGDKQRIELEHPAVLIGPNNCGKTSAIQALALWAQAVRSWQEHRKESSAKQRDGKAINRLSIVSVPVQRTRFFWHNTRVRADKKNIYLVITVGVEFQGQVKPISMRFNNGGDDMIYCKSDADPALLAHAAALNVELLYPMSGLETDEPILQPKRINSLMGQGSTAQVLRNLCLMVFKETPNDWVKIKELMARLFAVQLKDPKENTSGTIELFYIQPSVKDPLELAMAGRGFLQMLLIIAYLYSHKGSVLLVDEPDAHLEILRQKQIYVLLRDIASENGSQVVMVTHSEVILDEALDKNLTLLLNGKADNLSKATAIKNSLKHFGAAHYVKALERRYVLYIEGGTDADMLHALAKKLDHPVAKSWDERINSYYVQNNYPDVTAESELERVEGGFDLTPEKHFDGLRNLIPELKGLAILDNDGRNRQTVVRGPLTIYYWKRYEAENYFITPNLLAEYAGNQYKDMALFSGFGPQIESVLHGLIKEQIFSGIEADFQTWRNASSDAARLIWESKTERVKLSTFAEEFFRRLAKELGTQMLLTKGELHRLVEFIDADLIPSEVAEKLTLLHELFKSAEHEETAADTALNITDV